MHRPTLVHWTSLKRLIWNLKGSVLHGLHLCRSSSFIIRSFCDADWAGNPEDRTSIGAYLVYLGDSLISWKIYKQKAVARSSTEAEYRAVVAAAAEVNWIQSLPSELQISSSQPFLFCDNVGATYLSSNPVYHSRMKHISIDIHFVRQQVQDGKIKVLHVPSIDQLANLLTKPLPRLRFVTLRNKLGVSDGPSSLRGRNKDKLQTQTPKLKSADQAQSIQEVKLSTSNS